MQSYSAIPKNLGRQPKGILDWYPKERVDLKIIHDENNMLTDDELVIVRDLFYERQYIFIHAKRGSPWIYVIKSFLN